MGNYLNRFCGGTQSHEELMGHDYIDHLRIKNMQAQQKLATNKQIKEKFRFDLFSDGQVLCRGWAHIVIFDKQLED